MNARLTTKLLRNFPKIFRQHTLPCTQTAMCWLFECGDGWYELIEKLCAKIQKRCDKTGLQVEASQVKEKYGGLCFYVYGADDYVFKLISKAEEASYKTCEQCGETKGVKQTEGWIVSLCKSCMREYKEKKGLI